MQTNFNKKEPRECPECAKCKDDSIQKYFASLGSLKEHLLEHYRVKYYLENVSISSLIPKILSVLHSRNVNVHLMKKWLHGMMTMNQLMLLDWKSIWIGIFLQITLNVLKTNVKLNAKKSEGEKKKWYDLICHFITFNLLFYHREFSSK